MRMKHHIICKFNETVTDKNKISDEAEALFKKLEGENGIHTVSVFRNCTDKPNRFDLMIIIDMDKNVLSEYNESAVHKYWKANYSQYLESKAIFDCE